MTDDWKDDVMAETYGPTSDAQAQTPLADLVANALERMEAGARMILDLIPDDSSLSSSSHSQDVTREIARLCRIGASVMPRPIEEADNDYRQDYALFDETEGGWCAGSWDDDENGWFTASGQINPTHFIPLSALPKPNEVTT